MQGQLYLFMGALRGQILGGLPLAGPRGRLLGSCGGIVRAGRHPVPAPPGGFPFHTRRIDLLYLAT